MITNYCDKALTPHAVSHDMYVRLSAADIATVGLTHLYSESIGNAFSPLPVGFTEWTGLYGQQMLSLAWDWIILKDGRFSMPVNCVIRTNIMLVDGYGYDTDMVSTDRECVGRIATLGWQDVLQQMLQNRQLI